MLIIYIGEEYTIHMQTHSIALENFKYLNQTNIACMYLCMYVCVCIQKEDMKNVNINIYQPSLTKSSLIQFLLDNIMNIVLMMLFIVNINEPHVIWTSKINNIIWATKILFPFVTTTVSKLLRENLMKNRKESNMKKNYDLQRNLN